MIVPMLGWLAATAMHPGSTVAWLGLAATALVEMLTATTLFRLVGCEVRSWFVIGLWSVLLRPLTWMACWSPWPVVFRSQGRIWWNLSEAKPCGGES